MSFQIVVQPSGRAFATDAEESILAAGIRQGIGLPYGCKDGACGSCKCKKISGDVRMADYQAKALSAEEREQGMVLTCRATALSDVVLESRQVVDADAFPIKKMPVRVLSLEKLSHDVMHVQLQLPATEPMRYHAGQYVEFLLRDGSRRAYSMANAPHTLVPTQPAVSLHIRHMPGGKFTDHVFGAMKEKEIQRVEGPFGSFFLREDSDSPMVFLASGTGFAPIKALIEHMQHQGITRPTRLYWGGRRPSDLYMNDWVSAQLAHMPHLQYIPVVLFTRRCCKTRPAWWATRCMPAVHRSWWTLPAVITWRMGWQKTISLPTLSPAKPTKHPLKVCVPERFWRARNASSRRS
jgi:CDP-4-dehydro-6-deoxyglucose reductase